MRYAFNSSPKPCFLIRPILDLTHSDCIPLVIGFVFFAHSDQFQPQESNIGWLQNGISLKTQELYALVFLTRYFDLFTDFISVYNTIMKLVFMATSVAIVWCMMNHRAVCRSYDKELDTFCHYFLVLGCFALALLVHEKFTFQEIFWAFSIYLEAVAIRVGTAPSVCLMTIRLISGLDGSPRLIYMRAF